MVTYCIFRFVHNAAYITHSERWWQKKQTKCEKTVSHCYFINSKAKTTAINQRVKYNQKKKNQKRKV